MELRQHLVLRPELSLFFCPLCRAGLWAPRHTVTTRTLMAGLGAHRGTDRRDLHVLEPGDLAALLPPAGSLPGQVQLTPQTKPS